MADPFDDLISKYVTADALSGKDASRDKESDSTPEGAAPTTGGDKSKGTCPMCKRQTVAKYRPFCSDRCANLDLSRWLTGAYAIPVNDADDDEDGDDPGAALTQQVGFNKDLDDDLSD